MRFKVILLKFTKKGKPGLKSKTTLAGRKRSKKAKTYSQKPALGVGPVHRHL